MAPKPRVGKRLSDIKLFKHSNITARTVVAPIAAFTMAAILYVYARSSIHAAKRNAARHRAADGGHVSWYNESQRRHGVLERPEEPNIIKQLFFGTSDETATVASKSKGRSEGEQLLRSRKAKPVDSQK